jgi:hypothetical protein
MGADTMKITVVGALLIVATVVAGVLLLLALYENKNGSKSQQNAGIRDDLGLQYGTGAESPNWQ